MKHTLKTNLKPDGCCRELHAKRGFLGLVVPAIATATISLAAAGIYVAAATKPVVKKVLPKKAPIVKIKPVPAKSSADASLDNLKINTPTFVASPSPIPDLKASTLNVPTAQLPGKNMLQGFAVDKNTSYQGGAVQIETPEVDVNQYMPTNIPTGPTNVPTTGAPTTVTTPTTPSTGPTNTPTTTGGGQQTSGGNLAPSAQNCAQFSGVPSCSYVSDPNGATLCNSCRAAGM